MMGAVPIWSAEAERKLEQSKQGKGNMKLLKVSKLAVVAVGCLGLTGLARGQGHGGGGFGPANNSGLSHMSSQGFQQSSFGRDQAQNASTNRPTDQRRLRRAHKEVRQARL